MTGANQKIGEFELQTDFLRRSGGAFDLLAQSHDRIFYVVDVFLGRRLSEGIKTQRRKQD